MNKKFIGKSMKNEQWVIADNLIYDDKTGAHYLIPNLFTNGEINLSKRRTLLKYKVEPYSIGAEIGTDSIGSTLFTGDLVEVSFSYIGDPEKIKIKDVGTVIYDTEKKICYIRSQNRAFLFAGDSLHIISSIIRIGR